MSLLPFVLDPLASHLTAFPLRILQVESMGREEKHHMALYSHQFPLKTLLSNKLSSFLDKLFQSLVFPGDMSGFSL